MSAADQTLQKTDLMSSAAVLQAHQLQAALQQVASSSGLSNTSLLPGLLQTGTSTASSGEQLSVMLPAQQQVCVVKQLFLNYLLYRFSCSLPFFSP